MLIKLSPEDQFMIRGLIKRHPACVIGYVLKNVDKAWGKKEGNPTKDHYRQALQSMFTDRLPDGALKLLNIALNIRWDRRRDKELTNKAKQLPIKERLEEFKKQQIINAYNQCEYRKASSEWNSGGHHSLSISFVFANSCLMSGKSTNTFNHSTKWSGVDSFHCITVDPRRYFPKIHRHGIAVIDKRLILDAEAPEIKDGIAVYKVKYAAQSRGFSIVMKNGYALKCIATNEMSLATTEMGARRKLKKRKNVEENKAA